MKGDDATVAAICPVTLLFVYKDNVGIFPLLRVRFGGPAVKDKIMQSQILGATTIFGDLGWNVWTDCFVVLATEAFTLRRWMVSDQGLE